MTTSPHHLLLGPETHGVTRYAGEVAGAAGAPVVRDVAHLAEGGPAHLHVTDRLLDRDPAAAAAAVESLARRVRLTVTLHDVPQPTDGPGFPARAAAYGRMVRASHAWATNSWHEHALVDRWCAADARGSGHPAARLRRAPPAGGGRAAARRPRWSVCSGSSTPARDTARWSGPRRPCVAPGRRCGCASSATPPPAMPTRSRRCCGPSRERGVPVEVTGRVPEAEVASALRRVAVPVAAHRNVSASGSVNSWIAAGRRPLVRDGAYAREMAALRPGHAHPLRRRDAGAAPRGRAAPARRRPGSSPGPTSGRGSRTPPPPTARGGRRWADDRTAVRHERARQPLGPRPGRCAAADRVGGRGALRAAGRARPHPRGAGRQTRPPDEVVVADDGSRRAPVVPPGVRLVRQDDDGFRPLPSATSAWPRAPATCWCCSTPTRRPSRTSSSAWWRCPEALPEALVVGRRRHADLAGTGRATPWRRRGRARAARARRGCAPPTPTPATCWTPTRRATASSSAPSSRAAAGGTTRSAGSTRRSAPTAVRTGSSPTGPGRRAGCWPTARTRSPGTTARMPGSAGSRPRRAPGRDRRASPTGRRPRARRGAGSLRGPADVVVTCAPGLGDTEVLVTLDSLLAALPRAVVRLGERHRALVGADPRVVPAEEPAARPPRGSTSSSAAG